MGDDRIERFALVGGIAFDRFDQVRDQVCAAAKLDSDAAEASWTSARSRTSRL